MIDAARIKTVLEPFARLNTIHINDGKRIYDLEPGERGQLWLTAGDIQNAAALLRDLEAQDLKRPDVVEYHVPTVEACIADLEAEALSWDKGGDEDNSKRKTHAASRLWGTAAGLRIAAQRLRALTSGAEAGERPLSVDKTDAWDEEHIKRRSIIQTPEGFKAIDRETARPLSEWSDDKLFRVKAEPAADAGEVERLAEHIETAAKGGISPAKLAVWVQDNGPHIAELLRAALRPASREETAWLIEWTGESPLRWLSARTWEDDPNKATHYARKDDAEAVICAQRLPNNVCATEHKWIGASVRPASSEEQVEALSQLRDLLDGTETWSASAVVMAVSVGLLRDIERVLASFRSAPQPGALEEIAEGLNRLLSEIPLGHPRTEAVRLRDRLRALASARGGK